MGEVSAETKEVRFSGSDWYRSKPAEPRSDMTSARRYSLTYGRSILDMIFRKKRRLLVKIRDGKRKRVVAITIGGGTSDHDDERSSSLMIRNDATVTPSEVYDGMKGDYV